MAYLPGLPDFRSSFSIIMGSTLLECSEEVHPENKSDYPEQSNLAHPEEEDNQPSLIFSGPAAGATPGPPVVWGTLPIYANYAGAGKIRCSSCVAPHDGKWKADELINLLNTPRETAPKTMKTSVIFT